MTILKHIGYYYTRFGCAGVISVIKAKLTKRALLLTVSGHGLLAPLYLRIHTTDVPLFDQVFLRHEYAFSMKRPPAVIIDAGANSGLVSVYFARKYPQARIIAVEPEASNYELLERNVAPYSNIVPLNAALWDKNGELALIDPDLGKLGFRTEAPDHAQASPGRVIHTVRGMTVDAIMQEHDVERVDILKIDIEGSEREVFGDPSRWIGRVDALIVELHERMKSGCNRSFYTGTNGFDDEWQQGEHVCVTRSGGCLTRPA
jgi:FkbM family methyltransferase